jgi:hypothetical protein
MYLWHLHYKCSSQKKTANKEIYKIYTEPVFVNGQEPRYRFRQAGNLFWAYKKVFKYGVYAGIFKQSMGARKRARIGLSYQPTRLHRLAELILWNRFFGSLKV